MQKANNAVKKLEEEIGKLNKNERAIMDECLKWLKKRCEESEVLAEDILQEHKSLKRCYTYIFAQAKKRLGGHSGCVSNEEVFEWAEDYFHEDDRAEVENERKNTPKPEFKKEPRIDAVPEAKAKQSPEPQKKAKKKDSDEIEGQLDIFSLLGMQEDAN